MWKTIFFSIGTILIGVFAFIFGRGTNGSGIPDSDERIDNLRGSISTAKDTNNGARKVTGDIKSSNKSARTGIKTAKDILAAAKKRSMDT